MSTYQSFQRTNFQDDDIEEDDEITHESGVLIHVPESDRCEYFLFVSVFYSELYGKDYL